LLGFGAASSQPTEIERMTELRRQLVVALLLSVGLAAASFGRDFTEKECPIVGNSETRIYHVPGDRNYGEMLQENKERKDNRVCFRSSQEAEKAGYRRSGAGNSK